MLEIRSGVLLGSLGDALAVITRAPSVTKSYTITHLLTITNQALDWSLVARGKPGKSRGKEKQSSAPHTESCKADDDSFDGGEDVAVGREVEVGESKRTKCYGFQSLFVRLPDLPNSDLLHHFEECCRFIKESLEDKGTVLVHCEHGVSRSVTVVLAYLMWSEGRSFQLLFDELKAKKPEIRPNAGFMEQLQLWGSMRCRIDQGNKSYRAYRLQHMAKDMIDSGYVENLHSSLDPSTNVLESTAYFRCRKCRRLLFTEESVLQHELGRGQLAFKWHKRSKKQVTGTSIETQAGQQDAAMKDRAKEVVASDVEKTSPASSDSKELEPTLSTDTPPSSVPHQQESKVGEEKEEEEEKDEKKEEEEKEEGGSDRDQCPVPVIPTELAKLRAQLASMVATDSSSSSSSARCSSYFVEPVEWMEAILLGQVEGKILCPKCKGRLGSFNWAGEQCSCGQWVVPSFQIHRSKVDETRTLSKRKPTS